MFGVGVRALADVTQPFFFFLVNDKHLAALARYRIIRSMGETTESYRVPDTDTAAMASVVLLRN